MVRDPILQSFDHLARKSPERPLVTGRDTARAGEIAHLSHGLGERLQQHGFPHGVPIGLAIGNGPAFLAALLALLRCRLPALLLGDRVGALEGRRILEQLGAAACVEADPWADRPDRFSFDPVRSGERSRRHVLDPDITVVKLTSGSTGEPRGVLATSHSLVADEAALARAMELQPGERVLAAIPMAHSYGLSSVALPALIRGFLLAVPESGAPFDGLRLVRRAGVSFLPTVPAFLDVLLRTAAPPPRPPELRLVVSAGAPLPPPVAERFRAVYGMPVHVFYGATESGGITYDRIGDAAERGTVGPPVDGVRIDLEDETASRPDGCGGLVVRSPAVASGYHPVSDPRLGAGRFVTGDLARWRGDEIELHGRLDDLINVRGRKVNPREIERVLLQHDRVHEAAIVALPVGTTEVRIRAVVGCDPTRVTQAELLDWCRSRLADYKVPRSLVLVESLPRTARGKPDRAALVELATTGGG